MSAPRHLLPDPIIDVLHLLPFDVSERIFFGPDPNYVPRHSASILPAAALGRRVAGEVGTGLTVPPTSARAHGDHQEQQGDPIFAERRSSPARLQFRAARRARLTP